MRNVVKRNGTSEPLMMEKIKKCVAWISDGLDINPVELESKLDVVIRDGITTQEIHDNMIYAAVSLASPQQPDWSYAAGRAVVMQIWKQNKIESIVFADFVKAMVDAGKYTSDFLNVYTSEDIKKLGTYINHEIDLSHSYASVINAQHKYLMDGECIQHMHMINAMCIASVEKDERVERAIDLYHSLSSRRVSLATPWLSNLRAGGNISSCFIYKFDDSRESIADNFTRIINTSAEGGGMGIDLSRIRAAGSSVNGRKNSSKGITYTIKVINDLAVYFDQGGRRAGAITVHCPAWHADIESYLEIQDENKDPRKQSFDVFMQIGCHDIFMRSLQSDGDWYTFCPFEVRSVMGIELDLLFGDEFDVAYRACVDAFNQGKLTIGHYYPKSRVLIKAAIRKQLERGTPYIAFLDTINRHNPNKHEGVIPCVNLCTESFSNVVADKLAHTCNLASLVAGRMNTFDDFIFEARRAVRILSNGIQLTNSPDEISAAHNERYRTIGVGIMGLHDWLAKNYKTYNDLDFISKTFEHAMYGAIVESIILAKERGSYPAFKGSEWENGNMIKKFAQNSTTQLDWGLLQKEIDLFGIYNSQLTSPAPNTSTSLFMDAVAGVFPTYAGFFYDDNITGQTPVSCMYLGKNPLGYAKSQNMHNQMDLAKAAGRMQQFVDTGISTEYAFDRGDKNFNAKTVFDLIMTCWEEQTKAIYYIRSFKADTACVACAG